MPGRGDASLRQVVAGRPPRSLRQEWLILGVALLLLGTASSWLLYSERGQVTSGEIDRLQAQARVIDENLIGQLESANKALENARDEFLLPHPGETMAALSARLKLLSDVMPGVRTMAVLDAGGTIVASSRAELLARNYAQRDYFELPRRNPDPAVLYVTPPFQTVLGTYTINIGRALMRPDGKFAGVVVATLDPDYFQVLLHSVIYAPDMHTAAVHADGKRFLSDPPDSSTLGQDLAAAGSILALHRDSGKPSSVFVGRLQPTGEDRMVILRTVAQAGLHMDKPLVVSASRELAALYLPWQEKAQAWGSLYALFAAMAVLGLHSIQRRRQAFERLGAAAADALKSARHDLEASLDAVPSLIAYWDRNLINRFANRAYGLWFDVDPARLPGMHFRDVIGDALFERSRPYFEAALNGQAQTFERSQDRPDGSGERQTLVHFVPDLVDGEVRGFYALVHDVSELVESRQELAAALRDNDAMLRTAHLHSIVSVADAGGRIVDVNDSFCRISGYSRDELLGQTHQIVNSGVQDSDFWVDMWRTIATGQPWRGEICNRAKDGSLYWVDSLIAPFVGADGGVEKYISIRTDITAAKLTEQRLRASEAFLDRAGSIAGIGGWELDLRTGAVFWSAHTYRIHEVAPGQQPPLDDALSFYAPEARPVIERSIADAMAHGQGWDLELPFVTARGRAIWVRTVGTVELEDGKPARMLGTFQDITVRRQTEAALRETNERFALAADAAAIGVWELDVPSNTLVWDEWMYRLYGAAREAAIEPYALWAESLHPADRARCDGLIALALAGQGEFETEFRIVRPDGETRTLKAASRTLRDADGKALRMTGVNFDITELKRTESRLLETSSKLRSVFDAASEVAIIATDTDLTIQLFNTGAERLLGYASEELVGRATPICIHDADQLRLRSDELGTRLGRPVEGGAVFTEPSTLQCPREWTYVRKDGSRVEVSLVVTAMYADDGAVLGYLGIAHDVTQQKRLEGSLRHATSKAEQASHAKSEFLANMSHEIRTPLNAVIGLSYVLRRMGLDVEQAACVAKIELAGKHLLAVVNDVLDLSKVEAGALVIEHASFSPRRLLQDLAAVMTGQANAKGIALEIDIPDDLPEVLAGDAKRLSKVLLNLVSNGIKFTDRGRVCLRVRQLALAAEVVTLSFVVQDTGIGIATEVQSRLFAPFVQADASINRRFGGTGLGLSIVRRLARLMGGEVGLTSTLGVGSEFTVVLDFALAGPQVTSLPDDETVQFGADALLGVRVLVVDDSPINREVAKRILELSGAQVELAEDGQHAIDCLRLRPDEFEVVLMDVQMPVLDGLEATRRIRLEPGLAGLAVIALTAGALSDELEQARVAGMDDFIAKPFEVATLVATILKHVRPARLRPATATDAILDAPAILAWPPIDGIDAADAQTRLVGDRALFLAMLEQLLDEFADIEIPTLDDDAAALSGHAARLHRLGGSAGMLGARSVRELAGAAETACRAGDAAQAAALATPLGAALQTLRHSAASQFAAARAGADETLPDDQAELEPERIAELVELMRRKSLSALGRFGSISGQLRRRLGKERHARLRDHIERLQFDDAITALLESDHQPLATSDAEVTGRSTRFAAADCSAALPLRASGHSTRGRSSALRSVVYTSSATQEMSTSELEALLVEARAMNHQEGITGVLLYNEGNFMQCFEGTEESISSTYARIRASRQHHDISELMNEPVAQRSFQGWDMALAQPTRSELLALSTSRWKGQAGACAPALEDADGWELLQGFWRNARA